MPRDLSDYVRALVDQAPPLSSDQRSRLAALLTSTPARPVRREAA